MFTKSGWEIGSSFTAFKGGKRVVHLQGGVMQPEGVPLDDSTLLVMILDTISQLA